MLRSLDPADFSFLERVVLGGEVVGSDIISTWADRVQLFPIWAPNETTIANTVVRLRRPEQTGELGYAVNARCWIVRPTGTDLLASIGAPGELLIEGPVLAQGYYGDQAKTVVDLEQALFESLRKHAVPSLLIPIRRMPQTASGKVDRVRVRAWLGTLEPSALSRRVDTAGAPDSPQGDVERQLQQTWAQILNVNAESIGRGNSFFQLGGDSITAMQTVSVLRQNKIALSVQTIMRRKTLAKIAEGVLSQPILETFEDEEIAEKECTRSPIQRLFGELGAFENRFHQSFLIDCKDPFELGAVRDALRIVVDRHPMLRTRFFRPSSSSSWTQTSMSCEKKDICVFAATSGSDAGLESAIEQAHACIDLEKGPVIAVAMVKTPSGFCAFLVAHHMVIDLVSWRTVIHDLEQALQGQSSEPLTSISFQQWVQTEKMQIKRLPLVDGFEMDQRMTERLINAANQAFGAETIDLLLKTLIQLATNLPQLEPQLTTSDFPLLCIDPSQVKELTSHILPGLGINDVMANVEDIFSCVSVADYFLLHQREDPKRHNFTWTVKLSPLEGDPPLDPVRLQSVWKDVLSRHQALRAVFFYIPHQSPWFHQVLLRDCSPRTFQLQAASDLEARRRMQAEPIRFYIEQGLQHGFGVCSTPDGSVYCRLEMNYACTDSTSMGVLWKALCAAYCGRLPKQPRPRFSRYLADIQRQPIQDNTAYWCEFLEDAKPAILPTGHAPEDSKPGIDFVDVSSAIDTAALQSVCRRFDVTVPAVLLTAWGLLVAA
ncbi:hypothetical protein PRZ48_002566 [Zasmidium cellare]|uniref:Carrier domain-containing protein n=1 Tax=Zasmidium cellare TaxID=395010 RepID=A0ABR0ET05_ZASCE|nr:hypothetical protein PRZ48_002566 [Zasmidium cellare]